MHNVVPCRQTWDGHWLADQLARQMRFDKNNPLVDNIRSWPMGWEIERLIRFRSLLSSSVKYCPIA